MSDRELIAEALERSKKGVQKDDGYTYSVPASDIAATNDLLRRLAGALAAKAAPVEVTERDRLAKIMFVSRVSDHAADTAPEIAALCEEAADAILAAGFKSPAADEGILPGCTGNDDCPAPAHQHGCFSDLVGHCNEPEAHPAADSEIEWAVSSVTEDDGVRDIYYAVAPSEHVARDRLVRERASYPWPDEIQLAKRTVTSWVPVESDDLDVLRVIARADKHESEEHPDIRKGSES